MSIGNKRRGGISARQTNRRKLKPSERLSQSNPNTNLYGPLSDYIKKQVKERDRYRCQRCGVQVLPENENYSPRVLMVDHKTCRARGGTNHLSNLETLCDLCHENKPGSANKRGASLVRAVADQVRKKRNARR